MTNMKKKLNGDNLLHISNIKKIQVLKKFKFKSTLNNKW